MFSHKEIRVDTGFTHPIDPQRRRGRDSGAQQHEQDNEQLFQGEISLGDLCARSG